MLEYKYAVRTSCGDGSAERTRDYAGRVQVVAGACGKLTRTRERYDVMGGGAVMRGDVVLRHFT